MYKRVSVALFVLVAMGLGACGGDDDDTGAVVDSCTATMQSIPLSPSDPCPQTDPKCPSATYMAVATCGSDGKWMKGADGAIACACLAKGGGAGNTGMMTAPVCGNNKTEGMEQCDGTDLKGASCGSLTPGSSGMLGCSKSTCRYDTTMCISKPAMTGQGGDGMSGSSGTGD
jgi:hypothetical protein